MTATCLRPHAALLAALLAAPTARAEAPRPLRFEPIGVWATGVFDQSTAEIPAYDPGSRQMFVVNARAGLDVVDLSNPARPRRVGTLSARGTNSVAVHGGRVALAVEGADGGPGRVQIYDAASGRTLATVTTGPQPDMLCFSPDGAVLAVANEGEPRGGDDPAGGLTLIDTRYFTTRTFGFVHAVRRHGAAALRIDPVHADDPARDLEPEYLAFTPDGRFLVVGLQENNAVAVVDIDAGAVTGFCGLGSVDHAAPGAGLDPSDRDGGPRVINAPVRGLRQPDAIALHAHQDRIFLLTANEGDPRADGRDAARVADLTLDPRAFPPGAGWADPARLGRLKVSRIDGDADGDGAFETLYAFGGRCFSVFELQTGGDGQAPALTLRFDSGDRFERLTAALHPGGFNAGGGASDSRSDNRGPEPEGLVTGWVAGVPYVFVGLERTGGVTAWDLTDPTRPALAGYARTRDASQPPQTPTGASNPAAGDLGPEGLAFVPATQSPTTQPLLLVANEVSGTVRVYAVQPAVPEAVLTAPRRKGPR